MNEIGEGRTNHLPSPTFLVKGPRNKYFISFSEDGTAGRSFVSEEMMLNMINDEVLSKQEALDIYVQTPQLNCWM